MYLSLNIYLLSLHRISTLRFFFSKYSMVDHLSNFFKEKNGLKQFDIRTLFLDFYEKSIGNALHSTYR